MKSLILKLYLPIFILSFCVITNVFSQGIQFQDITLVQAMEKGTKENKFIFIDCYTSWCGPCKVLSKNVFPNDTVGELFNKNFVSLKVDMESDRSSEINTKYVITSFPTLLFVEPVNGDIVYKVIGAEPGTQWLISAAERAIDPNQNIQGLLHSYNENKKDFEVTARLIDCLSICHMLDMKEEIIADFLSDISDDKESIENLWDIIDKSVSDIYSSGYSFLRDNGESFIEIIGADAVESKIDAVTRSAVNQFIFRKRLSQENFPKDKFDTLLSIVKSQNCYNNDYYLSLLKMIEEVQTGDYNAMLDEMDKSLQLDVFQNADKSFYFIWLNLTYLFECNDEDALSCGLKWADQLKPNDNNSSDLSSWMRMKSRLLTAKGDYKGAEDLSAEAQKIHNPLTLDEIFNRKNN